MNWITATSLSFCSLIALTGSARSMTVTIAVLIRSSRSLKGKSGATGNPSLRSMCSRSSIASAPVKIERPPPAFGAADPMWAGGLRWADVTDARPATGYSFLEVDRVAGLRQIKPSECSGGPHKVAPDTDPPPPRAVNKKAAVDTSQGGLFRSRRETLFLIDGFRLHRLTDDPARLGGPTIQRAALVQHVLRWAWL